MYTAWYTALFNWADLNLDECADKEEIRALFQQAMIDQQEIPEIIARAFAEGNIDEQHELTWFEFNTWLDIAEFDDYTADALRIYFEYFDIAMGEDESFNYKLDQEEMTAERKKAQQVRSMRARGMGRTAKQGNGIH